MPSSSRSLGEIEGFIRDMRELGAASVEIDGIKVVFDLPFIAAPPVPERTPEEAAAEAKRAADDLLYRSSQ